MATIVVIEDEQDLCNLIRFHLEQDGHTVCQAFDGPTGVALVDSCRPQLVILDWMLPGLDGLAVCRRIRQHYLMPIIMLTARSEEVDRVLGLEVGADDYVVKPFSIRELLARVRSMLRRISLDDAIRAGQGGAPGGRFEKPALLQHGPLSIDPSTRRVTLHDRELELTRREFDLLALLASHPGRAFSREFLVEQLWGADYVGADRTVDSHIAQLRRKLGAHGERITTVWGIGYRFVV